jgi:hypothetical protein
MPARPLDPPALHLPPVVLCPPANDDVETLEHATAQLVEAAKLLELTCRLDMPANDLAAAMGRLCAAVDLLDAAESAAAPDGEPGLAA